MSHQFTNNTFEEFKKRFYDKIGDGTCFDVLDINFLKVVMDGLKVQYTKRGVMPLGFKKPSVSLLFILAAKILADIRRRTLLRRKIERLREARYFIGFSDRVIKEGNEELSIYFQKIFASTGRKKFCYATNEKKSKVNEDLDFRELPLGYNLFLPQNLKFFFAIKAWLRKTERSEIWTKEEIDNIFGATYLFYTNYIRFDFLFRAKRFEKAFLICHYHNEAFIFACKKHKIVVNELQHGLISRADIFYVFPEQVSGVLSRALFPDNIYVYGPFWKKILLNGYEYSANQIHNVGYYHYETAYKEGIEKAYRNKKIVLITTQYSIASYYIDYAKKLSPKLSDDWRVVVKIHPFEAVDDYRELRSFANVEITNGNLDEWIRRAEFVVTIFSTTIFDAIRLGKIPFLLNIPLFSDYLDDLSKNLGITLIATDDNPVELFTKNKTIFDSYLFYSNFKHEVLLTN